MQKELHKFIKGQCMVKFLLIMLLLQHEVFINALEGFSDLSVVTALDVAPVDVKVVFKVSLKDLKLMLISAMIGLRDSLLCWWFIRDFIF